jgi:hypothetical protein
MAGFSKVYLKMEKKRVKASLSMQMEITILEHLKMERCTDSLFILM